MLKILQVRLQQYMNQDLADVQVGFRKGRGSDQTANICWIIEKVTELKKKKKKTTITTTTIYFCFIDYSCDSIDHNKLWKTLRDGSTRPPDTQMFRPPDTQVVS